MTPSPTEPSRVSSILQLITQLERFATQLTERNQLVVHQHIDQFFYMQKCEELKILLQEYRVASERLTEITRWLDEKYYVALTRWNHDVQRLGEMDIAEGISNIS